MRPDITTVQCHRYGRMGHYSGRCPLNQPLPYGYGPPQGQVNASQGPFPPMHPFQGPSSFMHPFQGPPNMYQGPPAQMSMQGPVNPPLPMSLFQGHPVQVNPYIAPPAQSNPQAGQVSSQTTQSNTDQSQTNPNNDDKTENVDNFFLGSFEILEQSAERKNNKEEISFFYFGNKE